MPTNVIMPALELAQTTGKVLRWLKSPGDTVRKGEAIVEIETDKVVAEVEAPASGVLRDVTAREGDVIPVGQTIALVFAVGETGAAPSAPAAAPAAREIKASPLARKLAEQHGVDLTLVKTSTGRIEKADVLAFVERGTRSTAADGTAARESAARERAVHETAAARLAAASPKARRLAAERGLD